MPQVDLGPFKHTVDDGLELRKAAFECMDTLLVHLADTLDISDFVLHLADGLRDDHDIKEVRAHRGAPRFAPPCIGHWPLGPTYRCDRLLIV